MGPDDQHHDPATSDSPGPEVPAPTPARGSESDEGHQLHVPGMMLGTALVLEVRPHDVPFQIYDGQTFFKVVYDKMLEVPAQVYGSALGSSYQQQGLTLSKQFKA